MTRRLPGANARATFRGERDLGGARPTPVSEPGVPVIFYPAGSMARIEPAAVKWQYVLLWSPDARFTQADGSPFGDGDTVEIPQLTAAPTGQGQGRIPLSNVHQFVPAHGRVTMIAYLLQTAVE